MKCDETKPSCRRCTESGRKCEGPVSRQIQFIHDQPSSRSTTPVPQPEASILAPLHGEHERRAFHYFLHCAGPLHAGAVDAGFWTDLVPRLAQTHDFVWDVVVSLSLLTEHVLYMPQTPTVDSSGLTKIINREHGQALRCYNRAITKIRQLAEREEMDDSVLVLSCILFASVEFQQKNVKTGADMLKRCCKILTGNLTASHTRQNSSISHLDVHQVVAPFVLRKVTLLATLGNSIPPKMLAGDKSSSNVPKTVLFGPSTLDETRAHFHSLMYDCYELVRIGDFVPNMPDESPDKILFLSYRQSLLEKLEQWKASLTTANIQTHDAEADWVRSYLLMYRAVCYASLAACASRFQTAFDEHMDQFAEIVEHAAIYLKHSAQSTNDQLRTSFDPGVIPPLYFCATKCRQPALRREALRLMREAPDHETFWAVPSPDRVAAKVISAEEGKDEHASSSNDARGSPRAALPPEARRSVYNCVVKRLTPGGDQRRALEMSRFEYGRDGSRRLINEYFWLDEEEEA